MLFSGYAVLEMLIVESAGHIRFDPAPMLFGLDSHTLFPYTTLFRSGSPKISTGDELKLNLLAPPPQTEGIRHQARIDVVDVAAFLGIDRPAH